MTAAAVPSSDVAAHLEAEGFLRRRNGVDASFSDVASLDSQRPGCLSWVRSKDFDLAGLAASVVLVDEGFDGSIELPDKAVLVVTQVRSAFASVLRRFCADRIAIRRIDPADYDGHPRIGRDCRISPEAVVYDNVTLGDRCVVGPGVVLGWHGFGYAQRLGSAAYDHVPHIAGVRIGDDVEIGAGTCIDRGVLDDTVIGRGTKIDNLCQIGHNVRLGEDNIVTAMTVVSGSVRTGRECWFGPNSATTDGVTLGDRVLVTTGAVVMKDVGDDLQVLGNPGRPFPKKG